jgi:hypothetical protein
MFEFSNFVTPSPVRILAAVGLLALGTATSAHAAVIDGASVAAGEIIDLTFTPLFGLSVDIGSQTPFYFNTAPNPYASSTSVLGVNIPGILSTGVLTTGGTSNVNGSAGPRNASAFADVAGLSISLFGLVTLSAAEVLSTAEVHGDYGALTGSGTTTISGLAINGVPILTIDPLPNEVLFNALGLKLVLNYQDIQGDGVSSSIFATYAIAALLDDVPFLYGGIPGLLNGSVIISGSYARLDAIPDASPIPEPAAIAMFGVGALGLVAIRRKRS